MINLIIFIFFFFLFTQQECGVGQNSGSASVRVDGDISSSNGIGTPHTIGIECVSNRISGNNLTKSQRTSNTSGHRDRNRYESGCTRLRKPAVNTTGQNSSTDTSSEPNGEIKLDLNRRHVGDRLNTRIPSGKIGGQTVKEGNGTILRGVGASKGGSILADRVENTNSRSHGGSKERTGNLDIREDLGIVAVLGAKGKGAVALLSGLHNVVAAHRGGRGHVAVVKVQLAKGTADSGRNHSGR